VRLAKTLIARAHPGQKGAPAYVSDTQGALAAMVGGSRESVNRCLRRWQKAGLVDVSEGRISIADPDGLARAAGDWSRDA
jgi:CRP-like cAMP-binding protein